MLKNKEDESVVEKEESTEKAVKSEKKKNSKRATDSTKKIKNKANSSQKFSQADAKKNIENKVNAFFEANKEFQIRKLVSVNKLIEAGANIGSKVKYWNPKMKPFIYGKRNNWNYNIDLLKCLVFLDRAYKFLCDLTKEGGRILLVGTRGEIIKNHVKEEAKRAKCFYVNQRWLGGTLTNFRTINKSIIKLNKLIMIQLSDEIKKYSKKEQLQKIKENAVIEAKKLGIAVVALANTNADPSLIDFIIPCNTSSIKTTYLMTTILCDAICEGLGEPTKFVGKSDEEMVLPDLTMMIQNKDAINRKSFTKGADKVEASSEAIDQK